MKSINLLSKIEIPFFGKIKEVIIKTKSIDDVDANKKENEERLKKLYYIAVKTRNFEIVQLVQRNNFL